MKIPFERQEGKSEFTDLKAIDLSSRENIRKILFYDKHQVLEGLITEQISEQILGEAAQQGLAILDCETVIARKKQGNASYAFVWMRSDTPLLHSYLSALAKRYSVYPVRFDAELAEFFTSDVELRGTSFPVLDVPLQQKNTQLSGKSIRNGTAKFPEVDNSVRNLLRQEQGFWGFLVGAYGRNLNERVALPRVLKNFCIHPYFDGGVWDMDRIVQSRSALWACEVKHKFPFYQQEAGKRRLCFGLNVGELILMKSLNECGIQCLHAIIVKPYWEKRTSSMYLFYEMKARQRALIVGGVLDAAYIGNVLRRNVPARLSGADTTIGGQGKQSYRYLPVEKFARVGRLTDDIENIASEIVGVFSGGGSKATTARDYEDMRITRT